MGRIVPTVAWSFQRQAGLQGISDSDTLLRQSLARSATVVTATAFNGLLRRTGFLSEVTFTPASQEYNTSR